jgi:hypothetical protein
MNTLKNTLAIVLAVVFLSASVTSCKTKHEKCAAYSSAAKINHKSN